MSELKIKTMDFLHSYNADGSEYTCDSHCHNTYEIYMLINGNLDYTVGNKTFNLKPFDLLFIPPRVFHCPHVQKGPYERVVFNFKSSDIHREFRSLLDKLNNYYCVKNHLFFRSIAIEFSQSFHLLDKNVSSHAVKDLIELLLTELSLLQPKTEQILIHPILSQIIEYIDNNIDKKLSQESIAKQFYVTPSWINYSFKKHFDVCYSQYIKTKKMTYAQSLLQNGNQPKAVSLMCGFETYTTFLRQYKDFFNHPPLKDYIALQ